MSRATARAISVFHPGRMTLERIVDFETSLATKRGVLQEMVSGSPYAVRVLGQFDEEARALVEEAIATLAAEHIADILEDLNPTEESDNAH